MSENQLPEIDQIKYPNPFRNPAEIPPDEKIWGKKRMDISDIFKVTLGVGSAISIIVGALSLIGIPIYKAIAADGRGDYCYVEPITYAVKGEYADGKSYDCNHYTDGYELKEHRPWRFDRTIASDLHTPDDARVEAQKYNCEIK